MKLYRLLPLAIFLLTLVPFTEATTRFTGTYGALDSTERDFTQYLSADVLAFTGGSSACPTASTAIPVTGSAVQYFAGGFTSDTNVGYFNSSSDGQIFTWTGTGEGTLTITVIASSWNPELLWSSGAGSAPNALFVRFIPPSDQTVTTSCSGTTLRIDTSNAAQSAPGRLAEATSVMCLGACTGANDVGVILLKVSQTSESGIFNSLSYIAGIWLDCTAIGTEGSSVDYVNSILPSQGGNALYLYVQEFRNDSVAYGLYDISTSLGGAAIPMGTVFATTGWRVDAYRVHYVNSYHNTTTPITITIDASDVPVGHNLKGCKLKRDGSTCGSGNCASPYVWTQDGTAPYLQGFWSTDDFHASITVTVRECHGTIADNGACLGSSSILPNISAITYLATRTLINSTNLNGQFVLTGADLVNERFAVVLSGSGYETRTYLFTVGYGDRIATAYLVSQTAGGSGVGIETSCVTIDPDPGWFLVPQAANFTIEACDDRRLFYSIFSEATFGGIAIESQVSPLVGFFRNYDIIWPGRGWTNNVTGDDQVGAYFLVISNDAAEIVGVAPFVIGDGDTSPAQLNANNSEFLRTITEQIIPDTQVALENEDRQESVNAVEVFTSFSFAAPFGIPNMYLFLIAMIMIALLIYGGARAWRD